MIECLPLNSAWESLSYMGYYCDNALYPQLDPNSADVVHRPQRVWRPMLNERVRLASQDGQHQRPRDLSSPRWQSGAAELQRRAAVQWVVSASASPVLRRSLPDWAATDVLSYTQEVPQAVWNSTSTSSVRPPGCVPVGVIGAYLEASRSA